MTMTDLGPFAALLPEAEAPVQTGANPFDALKAQDTDLGPFAALLPKPAPASPQVDPSTPGFVENIMDATRQLGGAAYKGTGSMLRGVGTAAQIIGDYTTTPLVNTVLGTDFQTKNVLDPVADAVSSVGTGLQSRVHPTTKQTIKTSTPSGDLFDPSTWSFGASPSIHGYSMLGADVMGQMFPVLAASIASSGLGTFGPAIGGGAAGGAQGGGSAVEESRAIIDRLASTGELHKESAYYRSLLEAGKSPEEAVRTTRDAAERMAYLLTLPVSAAGGAATGTLFNPASKVFAGATLPTRVAARTVFGGAEEGIQEVGESIQTKRGINQAVGTNLDVTEGTFADFVIGALGGGTAGSIGGLASRRQNSVPPSPEVVLAAAQELQGVRVPMPRQMFESRTEDELAGPVWYSQLRRTIEESKQTIADASQWAGLLRNSPGVKEEEVQWTGLGSYLSETRGQVSREAMLAHLDENAVQIREVLKSTPAYVAPGTTHYEEYTAPGPRQGYRELLLTLSNDKPDVLPKDWTIRQEPDNEYYVYNSEGEMVAGGRNVQQASSNALFESARGNKRSEGFKPQDYISSHWNEPNVLAHVRFSDRVDASGSQMLHIEEVQSDWHQEGRKQGVRLTSLPHLYTVKEVAPLLPSAERKGSGVFSVWGPTGRPIIDDARSRFSPEDAIKAALDILNQRRVPDAPFKQSWPELSFKRMLRWAADNGYSRISWQSGTMAAKYNTGGQTSANTRRGLEEFYDRILPSIARKWAKRLGGRVGETRIPTERNEYDVIGYHDPSRSPSWDYHIIIHGSGRVVEQGFTSEAEAMERAAELQESALVLKERVQYIEIPAAARSIVRRGLPLFSRTAGGRVELQQVEGVKYPAEVAQIPLVLERLNKEFGIKAPVRINMISDLKETPGWVEVFDDGSYTVTLNLARHMNTSTLYATAMHEFGHVVMFEKFANAPQRQQQLIRDAYAKYRSEVQQTEALVSLWRKRDNAVVNHYQARGNGKRPLYTLTPEVREYWSGFDEWFAEQVAKWGTTSEKAVSLAETYLQGLGRVLYRIFERAAKIFGVNVRAEQVMESWLDSFITDAMPIGHEVIPELDNKTRLANQAALDTIAPELMAVEQQAETSSTRRKISVVFASEATPEGLRVMAASADHMNKFYKYMLGIGQLARLNRQNVPLQEYVATVHEMGNEENRIYDATLRVQKTWRKLGEKQGDNVAKLIDDVMNMRYRTDEEVRKGVGRQPTAEEFAALVRRHNVSTDGVQVFRRLRTMFETFLTLIEQEALKQAERISDPLRKVQALEAVKSHFASMRGRPYFPAMRFGHHYLTIRNAAGHVVHFETVERKSVLSAEVVQRRRFKELEATKEAGEEVKYGVLPEQVRPLIGMPPALLDLISEKLELSASQQDALEQLRFELSPAQSFKHRFQHKQYVPGYSDDFKRAFAHYFFHGAKFYSKIKYIDSLRASVAQVRENAKDIQASNKTDAIANYMDNHLQNEIISPKAAITWLHGLTYFYGLGYSMAAATLNLSQVPVISYPFLAAKFGGFGLGDERAALTLAKASVKIGTYYKKGNLRDTTQFDLRALNYAVRTGAITEAMAPEMAALSEGNNLIGGVGKTGLGRMLVAAYQGSSFMFELAEQFNRRVTFRAALELATKYPGSKWIQEVVEANQAELLRLQAEFTVPEARAILSAKEAVKQTQFEYSRAFSPRFMRGKARAFFIFKSYIQNTLFLAASNKSDFLPRYLLIMMFLGGFGGLPGSDDAKELARSLAWLLFGKDFSLEREARKFLIELGAGQSTDMILHGMARRGFRISDAVDMFAPRHVPIPIFDRSKALSPGTILPVELGKLFGPPTRGGAEKVIADQSQRASGAGFGLGFNLYKFLSDDDLELNDPKRWERVMPRFMTGMSKAARYSTEGMERNRKGAMVLPYDVRDTEQLGEIIGVALGYNPLRQQVEWDKRMMTAEFNSALDIRRNVVLKQAFEARLGGSEKELDNMRRAVEKFNSGLPEFAKDRHITADTLKRSFASRQRERQAQETNVPVAKTKRGSAKGIQELFPEAKIFEERRVR